MTAGLPTLVGEDAPVRVTVTGALMHRCPHVDEDDVGTVTIGWTCAGQTIEMHALADYLRDFADERISSEALTEAIRADLSGLYGIADVTVATRWDTAGLEFTVATAR